MAIKVLHVVAWIPIALALAATPAGAVTIIGFDGEPALSLQPNGFTSVDSPDVHFSDTVGSGLAIFSDAVLTGGSNALAVFSDHDDSGLLIEIDFLAAAISMDIGNDQLALTQAGDVARLTLFLGGSQVDEVTLALNRNGLVDQNIGYSGLTFDSAILRFDVDPSIGVTELVDNVEVTSAIPEPTAAAVYGAGLLAIGMALRQRSRAHGT